MTVLPGSTCGRHSSYAGVDGPRLEARSIGRTSRLAHTRQRAERRVDIQNVVSLFRQRDGNEVLAQANDDHRAGDRMVACTRSSLRRAGTLTEE